MRGGREVFAGLGFEVGQGATLLLRGPNGAGKSSLLRLVAGLVRKSAGTLALEGGRDDVPLGEQVHYVGHLDALKPALTVAENLDFWAEMLGGDGASTNVALERVGLEGLADFPAGILSAGQRRRLALARLIVARRPVWLLDEPTTAIDSASRRRLFTVLNEHLKAGGISLIATHEKLNIAARILNMGEPR